jgi:ssDNA-binding Zn-finger/Zn-ribbon topoisomerase 1
VYIPKCGTHNKPLVLSGWTGAADEPVCTPEYRCPTSGCHYSMESELPSERLEVQEALLSVKVQTCHCGRTMVLRRNSNTLRWFWGCAGWPAHCAKTRDSQDTVHAAATLAYTLLEAPPIVHTYKVEDFPRARLKPGDSSRWIIKLTDDITLEHGLLGSLDITTRAGRASALAQMFAGAYLTEETAYDEADIEFASKEAACAVADKTRAALNSPRIMQLFFEQAATPLTLDALVDSMETEMMKDTDVEKEMVAVAKHAPDTKSATPSKKKRSMKERGIAQLKRAGSAAGLGAGLATAGATSDIFIDMARDLAEGDPFVLAALESPTGRECVKVVMAGVVQTFALQGEDFVPGAEYIARAAELQITESTRALAAPRLAMIRSYFSKLEQVGKMLPASTGGGLFDAEENDEKETVSAKTSTRA